MKNKHENQFERCQLCSIKVIKFFFYFFPIEIVGILVCRGLLNDDELDFTDVFIVGIGFLLSTVKVFLGMKVGNFFVVVGVI